MSIAYIANDYAMLLLNAMRLCSNLVHIGNANYEQKIIHQIIHFEQDDIFKKFLKRLFLNLNNVNWEIVMDMKQLLNIDTNSKSTYSAISIEM